MELTGRTYIELVQAIDRKGRSFSRTASGATSGLPTSGLTCGHGGLGTALDKRFGFRCDTADAIGMGETKVHCTYIDDPDECWLEMIEVYKVPIIEKWGLFLDVQKRGADEPLPRWMLKPCGSAASRTNILSQFLYIGFTVRNGIGNTFRS